jgi:NADH-quinone oxidoreductase subunit N
MEVVAVLAALTITVGSMSAINQKSLKRLLAFSSVSHAGYMLIVVLVGANADDLMYYMIAYAIGSIVAFGVMMLIENETGNSDISSFDGLAKKNPFLGFIMTVAMLSLAGIPLTAGFMAKFYVLSSALNAGHTILVVVAILNAMVGIYYYFKVIIAIYFKEAKDIAINTVYTATSFYKIVLFLGIIAILVLGICPDIIHNLI